jgi:hypothetical protein
MDRQAGRQADMNRITVAFRLREKDWEDLQDRNKLAR